MCPRPCAAPPGLPDAAFIRGKTPMTKQEVRAAALAKLAVRPTDTLWDVARAPAASVWSWRWPPLRAGSAPWSATRKLVTLSVRTAQNCGAKSAPYRGPCPRRTGRRRPTPDAVFIGGSKGSLRAVVDAALAANPDARLCISAIALETLQEAVAALTAHGLTAQVTQIAVSRSRAAGSLHLLMASNPVFLIARE